jgi:capsular exopolysaccharide synthesis family protein
MSELLKALEQAEREHGPRRSPAPPHEPQRPDRPPASSALAAAVHEPTGRCGEASIHPHLVSVLAPESAPAEQYRVLRHRLEQVRGVTGLRVVAVSAPTRADGKTTTAINLAAALAQSRDIRVLLVDLDLRRPAVAARLALGSSRRGVVHALSSSGLRLAEVVDRLPSSNLDVLGTVPSVAAPHELLNSSRLDELIAEARDTYDWVVVDTPPLIPVVDCRLLGRCVDGFIVTMSAHRTSRKRLQGALDALDPSSVLGLVLNRNDDRDGGRRRLAGVSALWERWSGRGAKEASRR